MIVRLAEPNDLVVLLANAERYYQEGGVPGLPVDLEKAAQFTLLSILRHLTIIAEEDDKVVGALVLDDTPMWWTKAAALVEHGFYVDPDFRKGRRVAEQLLKAGKAIADDMGVALILTPLTAENVERKDRFYLMNGFKRIGGYYRWQGDA
jgi:GNAT superfamily N-acetyltransferase